MVLWKIKVELTSEVAVRMLDTIENGKTREIDVEQGSTLHHHVHASKIAVEPTTSGTGLNRSIFRRRA